VKRESEIEIEERKERFVMYLLLGMRAERGIHLAE
jgi:hypothetical protein